MNSTRFRYGVTATLFAWFVFLSAPGAAEDLQPDQAVYDEPLVFVDRSMAEFEQAADIDRPYTYRLRETPAVASAPKHFNHSVVMRDKNEGEHDQWVPHIRLSLPGDLTLAVEKPATVRSFMRPAKHWKTTLRKQLEPQWVEVGLKASENADNQQHISRRVTWNAVSGAPVSWSVQHKLTYFSSDGSNEDSWVTTISGKIAHMGTLSSQHAQDVAKSMLSGATRTQQLLLKLKKEF